MMAEQDKHDRDNRTVRDNAPHVGDGDPRRPQENEEILTEEELERAHMGWNAQDEEELPDEALTASDLKQDEDYFEDLSEIAGNEVNEMVARERRRDGTYRTGGDDLNPGLDDRIDTNAPKADEVGNKKTGGSRGKSDWN